MIDQREDASLENGNGSGRRGADRREVLRGCRAMLPVLLGVIPVALVTGVAAVHCGMTPAAAIVSSISINAAASQLVLYDMLGKGSSPLLAFTAAIVVNLRFLLYSAGMAPYLQKMPPSRRMFASYTLSDQAYGLTMVDQRHRGGEASAYFYFGAASTLWAVYQVAAVLGALLGSTIPASFELGFALPLTFSALLVPLLDKPQFRVAALVSATVAVLGLSWPNNSGFFVAALTGIAAGFAWQLVTTGRVLDA